MAFLVETALVNVLVASLLAVPALLAGLWGRRPALTHALWLLVLVKLITPPLFRYPIEWPLPHSPATLEDHTEPDEPGDRPGGVLTDLEGPSVEATPAMEDRSETTEGDKAPEDPARVPETFEAVAAVTDPASGGASEGDGLPISWRDLVALVWLTGSTSWLALAVSRSWRFHRLLRFAEPASAEVQALADELARCMGVRCPRICVVAGAISPMLWAFGGSARLLLPAGLLERLSPEQLQTLLAHELAHWQRRDHRLRWLELAVLTLYWWSPLTWWARRELHQAEEECCDAWVVSLLPGSARIYALALVETLDFLSGVPGSLPVAASGAGHMRLLKRRMTMILQGKTPHALTFTGLLGVTCIGVLMLPLVPGWAQSPDRERVRRAQQTPPVQGPNADRAEQDRLDAERLELQRALDELAHLRDENERRQRDIKARADQLHSAVERLKQMEHEGRQRQPANIPPPPPRAGSVEARLNEVEHKLDVLLKEMRELRRDLKQSTPSSVPGGRRTPPAGVRPGDALQDPLPSPGGTQRQRALPGGTPEPDSVPRGETPTAPGRPGAGRGSPPTPPTPPPAPATPAAPRP